jgi:hypothetical protein
MILSLFPCTDDSCRCLTADVCARRVGLGPDSPRLSDCSSKYPC